MKKGDRDHDNEIYGSESSPRPVLPETNVDTEGNQRGRLKKRELQGVDLIAILFENENS